MIVRESPKAKRSPDKNAANWPPKSPYEALLSSPGGRQKWQDRYDQIRQRTPSPSPRRPLNKSPVAGLRLDDPFESGGEDAGEDDEDEETLQLKLQAIEAKLKLRKLQQAKAKQSADTSSVPGSVRSANLRNPSPRKRPRLLDDVQVPVSPTRVHTEPVASTSPARVLLGIDKGLKAHDVSLKRARPAAAATGTARRPDFQKAPPRIKSFTERLAESRTVEVERQQKDERIQKARGQGFGLQNFGERERSVTQPSNRISNFGDATQQPSLLESARKRLSTPNPAGNFAHPSALAGPSKPPARTQKAAAPPAKQQTNRQIKASQKRADDAATLEHFSSFHLSKRKIPAEQLSSAMSGKELYPLPRLLKEIKSPDYYPPDCEADYVVFGIITSKTAPRDVKSGPRTADEDPSKATNKKYMILHLTDLKWELDLFLFGTAFSKYWKLDPGTAVAILNPDIMPPGPHAKDTGRFCLKLTSSADEVLELGTSRDLGFCESLRKDGTQCTSWVDKRSTTVCDFHITLQMDKSRSTRPELNTMWRSTGSRKRDAGSMSPPGRRRNGYYNSYSQDPSTYKGKRDHKSAGRDEESGERYYLGPAHSSSAVKLLDAADDLNAAEKLRRRLADKEKDRALMEKLGALGNGAGAEYMRATAVGSGDVSSAQPAEDVPVVEPQFDAASLGLVAKADQVRLSPVRGRRRAPREMADAIGWSGAFKRGLLDNQKGKVVTVSPERGQKRLGSILSSGTDTAGGGRSLSPKKKARFALEKGIREPGRESLGDVVGKTDDSDDDLDII
ncbi:hypothetical protein K461DRAFT_311803 [Myriangium duriaei CBS 260.36]|uniref:Zinc finger Mcm10/DnaG-type domain-containing protein n=1 Tax=Myriangium duriaei CBS 260.36 TaxID=1168546 RepID=A0A9P4MI21_9PEZI|nr:hypothetical protein K461DRAFT_311803 [Myriangium duriaei CBS 260.36]